MLIFMENYKKSHQTATERSRDKYSNFFAEAYQVSEDIDLQIMMSEMTVELRDILYSETEKVSFGTKVLNFIKSICELIGNVIRFITNIFKRNKKEDVEIREENTKRKEKVLLLEDVMNKLSEVMGKLSDVNISDNTSHKLMYSFKAFDEILIPSIVGGVEDSLPSDD